jgi:acetyl esterase
MIEYGNLYLPDGTEEGDDRAVPMRAALSGLPPAHVVVAGLDPLDGDRAASAARLQHADVAAVLVDEPTLTNGFPRAARFPRRAPCLQQALVRPVGETPPDAGVTFYLWISS